MVGHRHVYAPVNAAHHPYIPNFTEIGKTFCGQMDGQTYLRTDKWMDVVTGFIYIDLEELTLKCNFQS